MDSEIISLETHPEKWGLEPTGPASRTILQKITDTLEAAGIPVSGIETWPPEEDGRVSVSMTIRPRPEPKPDPKYTGLDAFIEACLEWDDSCCESVKTVYEKYKSCKDIEPANKAGELFFIRYVIGHFAAKGKGVKFFPSQNDKGESDPCLSNIRLNQFDPADLDEETDAALDAINANKAPDDPPAVRSPCGECADPDCDICPVKNHTPIKLYTPEEAADALNKGRVLRNERGDKFWRTTSYIGNSFCKVDRDSGKVTPTDNLSGLYEEARYV